MVGPDETEEAPSGMPDGDDRGEQETPMGPAETPDDHEPHPGSGDMPGIVDPGDEPPAAS